MLDHILREKLPNWLYRDLLLMRREHQAERRVRVVQLCVLLLFAAFLHLLLVAAPHVRIRVRPAFVLGPHLQDRAGLALLAARNQLSEEHDNRQRVRHQNHLLDAVVALPLHYRGCHVRLAPVEQHHHHALEVEHLDDRVLGNVLGHLEVAPPPRGPQPQLRQILPDEDVELGADKKLLDAVAPLHRRVALPVPEPKRLRHVHHELVHGRDRKRPVVVLVPLEHLRTRLDLFG
mmetsp:Transcript_53438/g.127133  ORF Transcript_53438/g.127133 Transcript_53438/m.127133 type:complete len:233 (+) Transcript_53438:792-1490(+)